MAKTRQQSKTSARVEEAAREANAAAQVGEPFVAAAAFRSGSEGAAVMAASPGEITQTQTAISTLPDGTTATTVVTTTTVTTTTTTTTTTQTFVTGEMPPIQAHQLEASAVAASPAAVAASPAARPAISVPFPAQQPQPEPEPQAVATGATSAVATANGHAFTVPQHAKVSYGKSAAYRFVKRAFDIVFSTVVLVAFCWLYLIIAIAVKVDSPGPAVFRQTRVGKDGKLFTFYKFRSMVQNAEELRESLEDKNEKTGPVFKIHNDPRITRVGRFIRKTSLDEMPQFVNVLRGDMSVVGPRPPLPKEVEKYTPYQRERLLIRPGLTCFWQTTANRDQMDFDDWIELDHRYMRECSLWVDFKLIVKTVGVMLSGQGS